MIQNQVRNDKLHKLFTTAKKISINYKEHPYNKEEIAPGDILENIFHKFVKIFFILYLTFFQSSSIYQPSHNLDNLFLYLKDKL